MKKNLCDRSIKKDCPCFKETFSVQSVNVKMGLKAIQEVSDNYNSSQRWLSLEKVQSKIYNFPLRNFKFFSFFFFV